jgi:hypothetical protein
MDGTNIYPKYRGFDLRPSRTADKEMCDLRIYLDDVLKILEKGKDASRSMRKKGTIEKVLRIRGRPIKVVVVESMTRYNEEMCWLITHVGDTREH